MLPKVIDPRRNADQDIEYLGTMQAGSLPRLLDAVEAFDGEVATQIRVRRDEQRRIRIQGQAAVKVSLICQRCMQSSLHPLQANIDLVIVYSEEQAKALPKELDTLVVEENLNLYELVEDELLLALPIVAYHLDEDCNPPVDSYQSDAIEEGPQKESPFAVLKDLTNLSD